MSEPKELNKLIDRKIIFLRKQSERLKKEINEASLKISINQSVMYEIESFIDTLKLIRNEVIE